MFLLQRLTYLPGDRNKEALGISKAADGRDMTSPHINEITHTP